ncbi:zonadhesin [Spodoptera frugiperda]|uniref:Zonadhesin n=1 Tax=Spodoptera frugiperda TaxID=7108 RepID=A0A9R0EGU6_SPOFR|nr:zonadhesin [Spodoptera frugiperda]
MFSILRHILLLLFLVAVTSSRSFSSDLIATDTAPINQIANITYGAETDNQGTLTSIFSPRMDFEQWKPLTGRGDPLRNDPTYDYEPPVLERVHYWADDTRLEREHYPERKSEVLMLGVSSRKPSVTSRQPPLPPRRPAHRPLPNKYEDFTYKLSEHYPMTILVPPPPPPPGHQPPLFILSEDKPAVNKKVPPQIQVNHPLQSVIQDTTPTSEHLTSLYALQESNLIYQSSTTTQNWISNANETKIIENAVSSDYAGWGPTTPIDDKDAANETHNLILNENSDYSKHPYSFYKPMLSESPPPPKLILNPFVTSTFVPTALPPTTPVPVTASSTQVTWPTEKTTETIEVSTETPEETTTEKINTVVFQPTPVPTTETKLETSLFDMLGPMMSMPMVNGPERPEDNLYAHASETVHIFNEKKPDDIQIETMQTMQPPPPAKIVENPTVPHKQPFHVNSQVSNKMPALYTHGPYLHNRFTTPIPTTIEEYSETIKQTTEIPTVPMYLIIQGHSKVKTYSSKPKASVGKETANNEISKSLETNEVKHLHPKTKKSAKKLDLTDANRTNKAKNLKTLVDSGLGSIEIQETDLGIKYDVSDGSDVPIEIYRKGIVDNDENDYSTARKTTKETRTKRQIDLEDLLPFDEETIDEFVYNFLEGKKNETSITGLIAQAVTSDAAQAIDELDEDDDDNEQEDGR